LGIDYNVGSLGSHGGRHRKGPFCPELYSVHHG